jgi:hypothetical protein
MKYASITVQLPTLKCGSCFRQGGKDTKVSPLKKRRDLTCGYRGPTYVKKKKPALAGFFV